LDPSLHADTHWPALQTPGHGVPSTHVPIAPQLRGVVPAHASVPGTQLPVQLPLPVHTNAHGASLCQAPWPSHTWGVAPAHCRVPGVHAPTQLPALHANAHSTFVLVTRSGPHSIDAVPSQTRSPGILPMHTGTGGWQEPCVGPVRVSQKSWPEQDCSAAHLPELGSQ
jgi:hypothetical protein